MAKVSINLLGWRSDLGAVTKAMDCVLAQSYDDFILCYSENDSVTQSILPEIRAKYGQNPKVRIVDNVQNLGYAGGHNKFFNEADTELVMVLNPDAEIQPDFLKNIVPVFENSRVAMVTGKMLKPDLDKNGNRILDGTGIVVYHSRRGRERGQTEVDRGQYDDQPNIFGVSGTAAVYRKSALDAVQINDEYFDTDFFAYWEDLDLSWRLRLAGYIAKFEPKAIVYHQRVAGNFKGGYKNLIGFTRHHSKLSLNVRRWNWRNHLFCIIKNDFDWGPLRDFPDIFLRELAMAFYITIFEPRTWGVLPTFFKLLPKMLKKRKIIQSKRKVDSEEAEHWFI